jgi:hypothetical protein
LHISLQVVEAAFSEYPWLQAPQSAPLQLKQLEMEQLAVTHNPVVELTV